jgi:hypothetical protein
MKISVGEILACLIKNMVNCGLVFVILSVFPPLTVAADDQMLLIYSGNVNGETEACG